MEVRRLQRLGSTTLVVSLPKKWASERGLKAGDSVYVEVSEEGVLIRTTLRPERYLVAQIEADRLETVESLQRLVTACYLQGVDKITVRSMSGANSWMFEEVLSDLDRLPGLEVIKHDDFELELRVIIDSSRYTIEELLRRMQALIVSMLESAIDSFVERLPEKASEVARGEQKIDSYYFLGLRQLLMAGKDKSLIKALGIESPLALLGLRVVLSAVEEIADQALQISRESMKWVGTKEKDPKGIAAELKHYSTSVTTAFGMALNGYLVSDLKLLEESMSMIPKLIQEINSLEYKVIETVKDQDRALSYRLVLRGLMDAIDNCRLIVMTGINKFVRMQNDIVTIGYE
ncbi:MAG: phosphate uptake regulator PhoU [Thaumarchaeota archaeon]|nr:phosphate uptake regulator PhoU [Candidatus Calditenuaceae archaeon]MDW8187536.1 phosphate uptake regulator PhoU [Nitrososphaerota archaeon]